MTINISENLKRLRKQKDITQEELARFIGVSFQAVSKWERGEGYPDITTLPSLANYFGISVDELIGMNEIAAEKKLYQVNQTWEENRLNKRHRENVILMKDALKIFPNNALLLVQLSASLERLDGSDIEKKEYLCESIVVQEQILRYCDDSEIRGAVLFNIADAYLRNDNYDKALEYARKLPNFYKTRENALVRILRNGKEKHDISKEAIERIVWSLACHMEVLAETESNKKYDERICKILDILYDGEETDYIKAIRERAEKNL